MTSDVKKVDARLDVELALADLLVGLGLLTEDEASVLKMRIIQRNSPELLGLYRD